MTTQIRSAEAETENDPIGHQPYVVSADIGILMREWTKKVGLRGPSGEFLVDLRTKFTERMTSIFPGFVLLDELQLKTEMDAMIQGFDLPIITLDRVYSSRGVHLDFSRTVNVQRRNVGVAPREGTLSRGEQLDGIVAQLGSRQEVVLVDDVIFEGNAISEAIEELRARGIRVKAVCAGVGIKAGLDRIALHGPQISCYREYATVVDEVCERDFYPGVPYSGRTLHGAVNTGLPYVEPFGSAADWASIPEALVAGFSQFCIAQTIDLFSEIERQSDALIRCCDLPRNIAGLPQGRERFVEVLKDYL